MEIDVAKEITDGLEGLDNLTTFIALKNKIRELSRKVAGYLNDEMLKILDKNGIKKQIVERLDPPVRIRLLHIDGDGNLIETDKYISKIIITADGIVEVSVIGGSKGNECELVYFNKYSEDPIKLINVMRALKSVGDRLSSSKFIDLTNKLCEQLSAVAALSEAQRQ
ncbi:MAG: hypothetical protein DRJ47_06730 [Thermoprotei archaeon]|nr:MAG: hypothetical protein DRJ47_06730 [Thermoprotei archaeon]